MAWFSPSDPARRGRTRSLALAAASLLGASYLLTPSTGFAASAMVADTTGQGQAGQGAGQAKTGIAWPAIRQTVVTSPELEKRIDDIMARMTLEMKVGQTIMAEIHAISPKEAAEFYIGGVLNGGGAYPTEQMHGPFLAWLAAANAFYDATAVGKDGAPGIPVLWGTDAVHGHNNVSAAVLFPHNIGLGAANNPALMRSIGEATAQAVKATGIQWAFAPTIAVPQDLRWGRTYEGYSSDPAIVSKLGQEMIIGLQGHPSLGNFLGPDKTIATAKHFLGDGGTLGGDDQGDARIDEQTLRDVHGRSYFNAIAVGVQTVMASFNSWNGQKAHGSGYLLTDVLKGKLGFDGFVVGDWNGHEQLPGCSVASCPAAINAGVDMIMVPLDWRNFHRNVLKQVRSGEISQQRLDDAVRRILRVKIRSGLLDRGRPSDQPLAGKEEIINHPAHRAIARQAVRESLVLLKNERGVLPLNPKANILVAGDAANDLVKQAGGWSLTWQGNKTSNEDFKGAVSIFAGLEQAVKAAGGAVYLNKMPDSRRPDAAIIVFGEAPYAEFKGDLEGTVRFEDQEALRLMQKLKGEGVPVVAVFISGRPRFMGPLLDSPDAFVAAWLPGTEGAGVADVLLKKPDGSLNADFKGKLPFAWPADATLPPLAPERTGGQKGGAALFPLGYGLTYAQAPGGKPTAP
jgi:beta-glucosidase